MARPKKKKKPTVEEFDFPDGRVIAGKYRILSKLGAGYEGEVYRIEEIGSGIERAAKFFYPHRNVNRQTSRRYARQLHHLRNCPIVIQYHNEERVRFRGHDVVMLVSEYVEGSLLSDFVRSQPGGRLTPFVAVHLLHALAKGMESIHLLGEYHGDIHSENIIVRRFGLGFEVKLVDLYRWVGTRSTGRREDIIDVIRVFYDSLGGAKRYRNLPDSVKGICCGLQRTLIHRKFRNLGQLREYLETFEWD